MFMERSASGTFLVFAAACALGYVWSTFFVPETANVSLEEMDAVFGSSAGREDVALKRQVRFCLFCAFGVFVWLTCCPFRRSKTIWGYTIL